MTIKELLEKLRAEKYPAPSARSSEFTRAYVNGYNDAIDCVMQVVRQGDVEVGLRELAERARVKCVVFEGETQIDLNGGDS